MASLSTKLRKTIAGQLAYASERSYLEYLNDSLYNIGIINSENLPFFKNQIEEATVKELLSMRDHLYQMRDLSYNIKAHWSILDRANNEKIEISAAEYKFHQDFVSENEARVEEYELAIDTPVQMIDRKLQF